MSETTQTQIEKSKVYQSRLLPGTFSEHVEFDPAFAKNKESFPLLQQVADAIQGHLCALDRGAAYIAVRVGVCLEIAKQLVKHGEFENFRDGVFGHQWSESTLQFYHALGKQFLKQHKELLPHAKGDRKLLTAEDIDPEQIVPPHLETPAEKFIANKTLADLLDEYGIKKRPKKTKTGGDHGGGKTRGEQADIKNALSEAQASLVWQDMQTALGKFVHEDQYHCLLKTSELESGLKFFNSLIEEIDNVRRNRTG